MNIAAAPPGLQPEDFGRIEGVLTQSSRGRMFLAECARRTKEAERARILEEVDRLFTDDDPIPASVPANAADTAAGLLDIAWSLRANGKVEDALCDSIEALARTLEGVNWTPSTPGRKLLKQSSAGLPPNDPRLARLSWLDDLPLADRLSIFA